MTWTLAFLLFSARAEYSDWCGEADTYHVRLGDRVHDVKVGDGGRVCGDDPPNQRPVTRFSATGGLSTLATRYAFFGGRVRVQLRHVKLRCDPKRTCTPARAGERCGIANAAANLWPGAEAYYAGLKADAPERRLAFDRVAWNALAGLAPARELLRDEAKWVLSDAEHAAFKEDLEFSRRHCDEVHADVKPDLLHAGLAGVVEGERLVPLGEFYDGHWNVSETAFHALYLRLDAPTREIYGLRTASTAALETSWFVPDGARTARALTLRLPFLLTQDEIAARRGFFEGAVPGVDKTGARVITTLKPNGDPERWRAETPPASIAKRARELFRGQHPRRFECLPRLDGDGETLSRTVDQFADRELHVYKGWRARAGDWLVAVRVKTPCRQATDREVGFAPELQRHWYFISRSGAARLVTTAKEAALAVDLDGDGVSEWVFSSAGVDPSPPYTYALFSRPRGEIIESH